MFTGIIETVQPIQSVQPSSTGLRAGLDLSFLSEDARVGDSIAVNGVCLTISELHGTTAYFDIMAETLNVSTLARLRTGQRVNLERAMAANGRFGGHFVQGHVDGIGRIDHIDRTGGQHLFWIEPPASLMPLMILKGSVAIDGVSLTIARLEANRFAVSLIPTTLADTNLSERRRDDRVNLEADLIGKWINQRLDAILSSPRQNPSPLTLDDLRRQGFA